MAKWEYNHAQVEIIPGITCDGYVLNDETAVMSERGTADLLSMNQMTLNRMKTNWPKKTLESFIDKDLSMKTNLKVEVTASNSPYRGRKIVVYTAEVIETIIRGYALAYASHSLKKKQQHIGERCVFLLSALTRTALDTAIKEACGF